MDIKHLLKEYAYQNIPLWYDQAYELASYALQGSQGDKLAMWQSITALSALHNKATYAHVGNGRTTPHSAAEQIAGVCAAVFQEDIAKSEFGFAMPKVPLAMDNCGMGGDLVVTANVSTLAALIAATAGVPMCKHGSPANADKGRHGSSDFVALCGLNPFTSKEGVERSVERYKFGYTEALDTRFKLIHLHTHEVAKLPHMNDIIGPITNPVHSSILRRRIIGVNHLIAPRVVAEAYHILNSKGVTAMERVLVLRGRLSRENLRGMDEASICEGGTEVAELWGDEIIVRRLFAEDFGIKAVSPDSISPPEGVSKGEYSLRIMRGEERGAGCQMVLANTALLLSLVWEDSLPDLYRSAQGFLESGAVPALVERLVASQQVAS